MNKPVDLTNCDREPIHIPGSIQPFGFLLGRFAFGGLPLEASLRSVELFTQEIMPAFGQSAAV